MLTRFTIPGALVLLATLCATAVAEPPRTFAFQGVLTSPSGAYVADGSYSLTFRLYADLTGGSALWTESKSVSTSKGRFATALGDTTAFPSSIYWGNDDYFVSIQVAADPEATPRVPLIGVPYALGLPGVTVATGGNVGIGTTSPGHRLDVNGDINASGSLREMGIPLPSRYAFVNGSNATGTWPINIGGSAPAGSLSGIVPIAKGGTGTSASPAAAGEYLRSTGAGAWAPGTIPASDIPNLSATYMDLTTNQTAAGVKSFSDKVGVRTSSPTYALDVNGVMRTTSGLIFGDGTIQLSAAWHTSGNAGTSFGTNFLGTTDSVALDLRVNNISALQLWPVPGGTPNIRGGYGGNVGGPPAQGVFLGGGGYGAAVPHPNVVFDDFGVLCGGADNTVGANDGSAVKQHYATVGGGQGNSATDAMTSVLGGDRNSASSLYATVVGGGQNAASGNSSFVGGGRQNQAQGLESFVGGGAQNVASGQESAVSGGDSNTASGLKATIAGGWMNRAIDPNTTVGGGQSNVAGNTLTPGGGNHATVGGGAGNQATGGWSTIPGGNLNTASGACAFAAGNQAGALHNGAWVWADNQAGPVIPFNSTGVNQFLIRAQGNVGVNTNAPTSMLDVNGQIRTRAGGVMFPDGTVQVTASGPAVPGWSLTGNAGTVPGANFLGTTDSNLLEVRVNNTHAMRFEPSAGTPNVAGGFKGNAVSNAAQGVGISAGGVLGAPNTIGEDYGFIGGGSGNNVGDGDAIPANSPNAVIAGGESNRAGATHATVCGGHDNSAGGPWSSVLGGQENAASGSHSAVGGGLLNKTGGMYATVPGGLQNQATGLYSFAAGHQAVAAHSGAFVWADSGMSPPGPLPFTSITADEFSARCVGGARFVTAINALGNPTAGVWLPAGSSGWLTISDRNAKENFAAIDPVDVVRRLAAIPIETWNYKTQDDAIRHMGPMAQDFSAAFAIGEERSRINSIDADGVALAAAQGLYRMLQEKDARIAALEARLSALEARLGPKRSEVLSPKDEG